jgi:hypothetical protein
MIYNEYPVNDIVLAACLKLNMVKLDRISVHGKRGTFHFKDVPEQFLNDFDSGNVLVEPCSFHAEIRNLNSAIKRILTSNV